VIDHDLGGEKAEQHGGEILGAPAGEVLIPVLRPVIQQQPDGVAVEERARIPGPRNVRLDQFARPCSLLAHGQDPTARRQRSQQRENRFVWWPRESSAIPKTSSWSVSLIRRRSAAIRPPRRPR